MDFGTEIRERGACHFEKKRVGDPKIDKNGVDEIKGD